MAIDPTLPMYEETTPLPEAVPTDVTLQTTEDTTPAGENEADAVPGAEEAEPATEENAPTVPASNVDPAACMEKISERLEKLECLMQDLARGFTTKLRYDATKQQIIDRQHEELERYRHEQALQISRAVISDVISEADDAEKTSRFYKNLEPTEENFHKLLKLVVGYGESLRDLLERNDIYAYCCEPGAAFNPKRQRVFSVVETDDPALGKTVKESVRWGFADIDGKVVRPEMVNVYVYKKSEE